MAPPAKSAAELRALFDAAPAFTLGLEEELMVLDAETLDLTPRAPALLAACEDPRARGELPLSQVEIVTAPGRTVAEGALELAATRRRLSGAAEPLGLSLAAAGSHPFAAPVGTMSNAPRYRALIEEYSWIVRRSLIFGLHVHVAVPGADRALAVWGALRSRLPVLAALAANAPFLAGEDTRLASVRPKIADDMPRQGMPPAFATWEELAGFLEWAEIEDPTFLWWEARPHPTFGTVEVRVPDAQRTVAEEAAIAALVHCSVVELAERHDAGELPPRAARERLEENRWRANRHGLEARLLDPEEGAPRPAREVVESLITELAPMARRLDCAEELASVAGLLEEPGYARQRRVAEVGGTRAVMQDLNAGFLL